MSTVDVEDIVRYFETLTSASIGDRARVYVDGACFKDPFNEVKRLGDIRAIFERMFEALAEPRFTIVNRVSEGAQVISNGTSRSDPPLGSLRRCSSSMG